MSETEEMMSRMVWALESVAKRQEQSDAKYDAVIGRAREDHVELIGTLQSIARSLDAIVKSQGWDER